MCLQNTYAWLLIGLRGLRLNLIPMWKRVFANRFISTMRETLVYVKLPPIPHIFVELLLVHGAPVQPFFGFPGFEHEWWPGFKKVMWIKVNLCSIKYRSKHSTVLLLCLIWNLMEQSLCIAFYLSITLIRGRGSKIEKNMMIGI